MAGTPGGEGEVEKKETRPKAPGGRRVQRVFFLFSPLASLLADLFCCRWANNQETASI